MGLFGALLAAVLPVARGARADNLWLIESEEVSGFAIYRTGAPDEDDMGELCAEGIRQMVVLSGNAGAHERRYAEACPSLEVVYDHRQDVDCPLSSAFLEDFDRWVARARAEGWKIAFRCDCGCHRTGRLAAYYQMKYQGLTLADALAVMRERGEYMWYYWPRLEPQVVALKNYIDGEACQLEGSRSRYCVDGEGRGGEGCAAAQAHVPIALPREVRP